MSRTSFPWRWLFFIVFLVIGALLAYDVHLHKGYKKSRSYKVLKESGILFYLEQISKRCQVYSSKALTWLQENVPVYYSKVCETVGPYLTLFWHKLYELAVYMVELTIPVRLWLNEKIPLALEWMQETFPTVWESTKYYLSIMWAAIVTYTLIAWEFIVYYTNIATTWLLENVFTGKLSPENILVTVSSWLTILQGYIQLAIQSIMSLINGPATGENITAKQQ